MLASVEMGCRWAKLFVRVCFASLGHLVQARSYTSGGSSLHRLNQLKIKQLDDGSVQFSFFKSSQFNVPACASLLN